MRSFEVLVRRMAAWWGVHPAAVLFLVAVALGGVAGLLSAAFWNAIAALSAAASFYLVRPADQEFALPWPWASWAFLTPALGGLLVGWLAHFVFRTPDRLGVPAVMLDARREWGRIPLRYVPATFVNGTVTIGMGGSAGREAPVVAMGGGLGAWVARRLRVPPAQRRLLVGCGAAAAIAAAFNAPLAGVFFAVEVLLGDWRAGTLAPVMLASVAGTVACRAAEGSADAAHFQVAGYQLASWWEPMLYAGLGLVAGSVGHLFAAAMQRAERFFAQLPVRPWLRPAVGGLGVGLLGLAAPGALGNGYPWAIAACEGSLTWQVMLLLVGAKVAATALTLGSGGWGGDFAPTLLIGAVTGGVYGVLLATVIPGWVAGAGAYAMVGMGAVLAAVIRCPVTAVLLLFELTGSYEVVLPAMVAVTVAIAVAGKISPLGLYHRRLRELGGPAFEVLGGELAQLPVRAIMRPLTEVLPADAPLECVLQRASESPQLVFPVVRRDGGIIGVVRLADLRFNLHEHDTAGLPVVAADVAIEEVPHVYAEDSAQKAAALLAEAAWEELPVLDTAHSRVPIGLVSRHDVLRATLSQAGGGLSE